MPKLIVIVEDSETTAPLEIALGSLNGFAIRHFSNGRDAVNFLKATHTHFSALITDLNLPFLDGFQLVEAVRADSRFETLPIIVLSGDADPETPSRLKQLGVNAFFAKPYSPARVRDTLEALLYAE